MSMALCLSLHCNIFSIKYFTYLSVYTQFVIWKYNYLKMEISGKQCHNIFPFYIQAHTHTHSLLTLIIIVFIYVCLGLTNHDCDPIPEKQQQTGKIRSLIPLVAIASPIRLEAFKKIPSSELALNCYSLACFVQAAILLRVHGSKIPVLSRR